MNKIRQAFTKWYIKKGYTFECELTYPWRAHWGCPRWVHLLLFLFSPSVYVSETLAKPFAEGFEQGIKESNASTMCGADMRGEKHE